MLVIDLLEGRDEIPKLHHQVATCPCQNLQSIEETCSATRSIFPIVPRRRRSKGRNAQKENTEVLESGKYKIEEHRNKNHLSSRRCMSRKRKRKRKTSGDSSDSEVIKQHFRVRGQRSGHVYSCNSITQGGKLGSNTFQGYLEHIWRGFPEEKRNSCTYLDSMWFSLYMQNSYREKVLNWIKRKSIFSKRYVIIPIVMWSHWSLLILCHFGENPQSKSITPCMLLLDSLQKANPRRLEPGIRKFVLDIHNIEDRPENKQLIGKIPLLIPKVPQQRNEECGRFALYYISLFLETAPENFSVYEGYPYFMKEDWFSLDELDNFCRRLELNSTSDDPSASEDDDPSASEDEIFIL